MQIVIEIPEPMFDWFDNGFPNEEDAKKLWHLVKNGTPLPKGHGRLIDADKLKEKYPHDTDWNYPINTNRCVVENIDNSPAIIEPYNAENER